MAVHVLFYASERATRGIREKNNGVSVIKAAIYPRNVPEDKFHKLTDDMVHDLLEKLEVLDSSAGSPYLSISLEASLKKMWSASIFG